MLFLEPCVLMLWHELLGFPLADIKERICTLVLAVSQEICAWCQKWAFLHKSVFIFISLSSSDVPDQLCCCPDTFWSAMEQGRLGWKAETGFASDSLGTHSWEVLAFRELGWDCALIP